jgi:hypothetical protein
LAGALTEGVRDMFLCKLKTCTATLLLTVLLSAKQALASLNDGSAHDEKRKACVHPGYLFCCFFVFFQKQNLHFDRTEELSHAFSVVDLAGAKKHWLL